MGKWRSSSGFARIPFLTRFCTPYTFQVRHRPETASTCISRGPVAIGVGLNGLEGAGVLNTLGFQPSEGEFFLANFSAGAGRSPAAVELNQTRVGHPISRGG